MQFMDHDQPHLDCNRACSRHVLMRWDVDENHGEPIGQHVAGTRTPFVIRLNPNGPFGFIFVFESQRRYQARLVLGHPN